MSGPPAFRWRFTLCPWDTLHGRLRCDTDFRDWVVLSMPAAKNGNALAAAGPISPNAVVAPSRTLDAPVVQDTLQRPYGLVAHPPQGRGRSSADRTIFIH